MKSKSFHLVSIILLALVMAATGCKKSGGGGAFLPGSKDEVPPTVESTSPNDSDFGVALSANITVRFNEKMAASTVNNTNIEVTDGATPVTGVVTYSDRTATFNPSGDLSGLTTYTVTVHREVTDRAGNMMDADHSFIFTTVSEGTVANPEFSPIGGTYEGEQTVTITCATADSTIYYTTNGDEPSTGSAEYSGSFLVSVNTQVKAMAVKVGMDDSETATADYAIRLAEPELTPAPGNYSTDQNVSITATDGATIYYTTNGDDPTTSSAEYSGTITVAGHRTEMTIKAIAVKTGMTTSLVGGGDYAINYGKTAAPSFDPVPGTFDTAREVTITSTTPDTEIWFTTNGDTPSKTSGTKYEVPVNIGVNTTLKAIAYKVDLDDSDVSEGEYLIRTTAPSMDPSPGTYSTDQGVTLSAAPGAIIYYTTNGDEPTTSSDEYGTPIPVAGHNTTMTIRAIAVKAGMTQSTVSSGTYTINYDQAAEPTFDPAGATYTGSQSVTISCSTGSVTIMYTTNGDDPSRTHGIEYSGGTITVDHNMTLKAIAYKDGMLDSGVSRADYLIRAAAPEMSLPEGTYNTNRSVTLTAEPGATIYFTTNGDDPTTSSSEYSDPIPVTGNGTDMTIKAIAVIDGLTPSTVASARYIIDWDKVADPTFLPVSGTYSGEQSVAISCTTDDAIIMYTTNGDDPRTDGLEYGGAITVSANTTIRAYAYKSEMEDSDTVSSPYHIRVAAPEFTPGAGTHGTDVDVVISCDNASATIYYTTNGDEPTTSSSEYTTSIPVHGHGTSTTIRAIAVYSGLDTSEETSGTFTIDYSLTPARWGQAIWGIHKWNP